MASPSQNPEPSSNNLASPIQNLEPSSDNLASPIQNPQPSSDSSIRNCPICMDPVVQGMGQKFLSCAHVFHEPCIDRWLTEKTTCPVCRNQELKPPPAPPLRPSWHIMPAVNLRGIVTVTEVLPSAVRPRQQSVHGRRRARRREATGRSRSRGARSRSRAPSAAAAITDNREHPPTQNGDELA